MRQREGVLPDLEKVVFQKFCAMSQRHIPITQEMIQKIGLRLILNAKAELQARPALQVSEIKRMKALSNFKCSLNWVARFRQVLCILLLVVLLLH
jgi:uncharacterized small protein (DUF1192 family)